MIDTASASKLAFSDKWFRYWMPYCFRHMGTQGRKFIYLPLNRNYKPLGQTSDKWVEYEKYLGQALIFGSDPKTFKGIWGQSGVDASILYLYSDGPSSRRDYFERLGKLLAKAPKIVARSEED